MPLRRPAVSRLARETIKTAYDELERTITPLDSREFPQITLQHVQKAAVDIENELAARQSLRNMRRLMPLFQGMEHYSKVMDILCNGTPYLAWIWAPITLILRVASEFVEAFEHIIKAYARIAESLGRFERLGNAFVDRPEFQQTLAVFYADILEFHKHAYKFVRRSGWRLMFVTSWGRFQRRFDNILEEMDRHGNLIDKEAISLDIAEARQHRQNINTWREEEFERIRKIDEEQAARQYRHVTSWLQADDLDQLVIFDSRFAEGDKYPGTCTWALKNNKLAAWLRPSSDTSFLWLQGVPGSGKSILSSQLINFLRTSNDHRLVMCHFIHQSYSTSIAYDQILRSLLLQLLRDDNDLASHVYHDYVSGKKPPSTSALEQLLKTMFAAASSGIRKTQYIWIIIDGLDVCESERQASLVGLMSQIVTKSAASGANVCKVLFSSRKCGVLSKRFRKGQIVSLTDEKAFLDLAIREYVSRRLESLHERLYRLHLEQSDVEEIASLITTKADGMFLYARLILDYIERKIFYDGSEVKKSIDELPKELSDFYRKLFSQILAALDPESVERVKSLLGWIAFAKRPLKRLELLSALTFSSGNPDAVYIVDDFIITVCGNVIEEQPDNTLAFIHITVKDFLQTPTSHLAIVENESIKEHGLASVTCMLSGLQFFGRPSLDHAGNCKVILGFYGLFVYAAEFWTEYLLTDAVDLTTSTSSKSMFRKSANLLASTLARLNREISVDNEIASFLSLDSRLQHLEGRPELYRQVAVCLRSRSLVNLDAQSATREGLDHTIQGNPGPVDALTRTLEAYQTTLRFILARDYYSGVTAEDLKTFKSQFQQSAFTCRLRSCPHAIVGFKCEKSRDHHEEAHGRRFICNSADCKYPPFVSAGALRAHVRKYHEVTPAHRPDRKTIRQTNKSPTEAVPKGKEGINAMLWSTPYYQVTVYKSDYRSFDYKGSGWCNIRRISCSGIPYVIVESEKSDEPRLLEIQLTKSNALLFSRNKICPTSITFGPGGGFDTGLNFQQDTGSSEIWKHIEQARGLPKSCRQMMPSEPQNFHDANTQSDMSSDSYRVDYTDKPLLPSLTAQPGTRETSPRVQGAYIRDIRLDQDMASPILPHPDSPSTFVLFDNPARRMSTSSPDGSFNSVQLPQSFKAPPKLDQTTLTDIYSDGQNIFSPSFTIPSAYPPPRTFAAMSPSNDLFSQALQAANSRHLSAGQSPISSPRNCSPFRSGSPFEFASDGLREWQLRMHSTQQIRKKRKVQPSPSIIQFNPTGRFS